MTEQQDVLDPKRSRRRRTPVILLGMLPIAVAGTLLIAGPQFTLPEATTNDAAAATAAISTHSQVVPGVVASVSTKPVDATATVQRITVTMPTVATPVVHHTTVKPASTAKKSTVKKSTVKKSSRTSYKSFCANPGNPVSASGRTGKALLAAVNKERAKLGIKAMGWSSSMASTATSWSKHQVASDAKTKTLIDGLAHNPNRPGAENVAVVYNSGGLSAGSAIKKMHINLVHSNGHCLNLMNPKYRSMGAGVASSSDGNTWYATENFR